MTIRMTTIKFIHKGEKYRAYFLNGQLIGIYHVKSPTSHFPIMRGPAYDEIAAVATLIHAADQAEGPMQ